MQGVLLSLLRCVAMLVRSTHGALLSTSDARWDNQIETELTGLDLLGVVVDAGRWEGIVTTLRFLRLALYLMELFCCLTRSSWVTAIPQLRVTSACLRLVLIGSCCRVPAVRNRELWSTAATLVRYGIRSIGDNAE